MATTHQYYTLYDSFSTDDPIARSLEGSPQHLIFSTHTFANQTIQPERKKGLYFLIGLAMYHLRRRAKYEISGACLLLPNSLGDLGVAFAMLDDVMGYAFGGAALLVSCRVEFYTPTSRLATNHTYLLNSSCRVEPSQKNPANNKILATGVIAEPDGTPLVKSSAVFLETAEMKSHTEFNLASMSELRNTQEEAANVTARLANLECITLDAATANFLTTWPSTVHDSTPLPLAGKVRLTRRSASVFSLTPFLTSEGQVGRCQGGALASALLSTLQAFLNGPCNPTWMQLEYKKSVELNSTVIIEWTSTPRPDVFHGTITETSGSPCLVADICLSSPPVTRL